MGFGAIVEEVEEETDCHKKQEFAISKEALEAKSIAHYHIALKHQKVGQIEEAIHEYLKLVSSCYIDLDNDDDNFIFSSKLKYLCLKNIGELYLQMSQKEMALKFFIEALQVDSSRIEMHTTVGKLALDMKNYNLARHSYEMAFEVNPENLFCAKKYVSILFIQENYESCLQVVLLLLEKNQNFIFGYVLLGELFAKLPSLKVWLTAHHIKIYQFFLKNKNLIFKSKNIIEKLNEEKEEAVKYAKEEMKESSKRAKIQFLNPFKLYSWKEVGRQLLALHNYLYSGQGGVGGGGGGGGGEGSVRPTLLSQAIDFGDLDEGSCEEGTNEELVDCDASALFTSLKSTPAAFKFPNEEDNINNTFREYENNDEHDNLAIEEKNAKSEEEDEKVEELGVRCEVDGGDDAAAVSEATTNDVNMPPRKNKSAKKESERADEGRKKVCKRKGDFALLDDDFKRRSKRVKNSLLTGLNADNELNSIMKLLPFCFQKDFHDLCKQELTAGKTVSVAACAERSVEEEDGGGEHLSEDEVAEVKRFLAEMKEQRSGVVDMVMAFLVKLESLYLTKWSAALSGIFVDLYHCLRSHLSLNIHLSGDFSQQMGFHFIKICLVHLELSFDLHHKASSSGKVVPEADLLHEMEACETFFEDLNYVTRLSQNMPEGGDGGLDSFFEARVHWLNYLLHRRQMDVAMDFLQALLQVLETSPEQEYNLPNCSENRVISQEEVSRLMGKLKKRLHAEDVSRMYADGELNEVVDIIKEVLVCKEGSGLDLENDQNREQTTILLNCYVAMQRYAECLAWSVKCLSTHINHLLDAKHCIVDVTTSTSTTTSSNPLAFLHKLFDYIDVCLLSHRSILAHLPFELLQLLVACICKLLEAVFQITADPNGLVSGLPCEHVTKLWMLLYRLLKWHYCRHVMPERGEGGEEEEEEEVPGFLKVLIKGHDYLARKGWCCALDGKYLLFLVAEAASLLSTIQKDEDLSEEEKEADEDGEKKEGQISNIGGKLDGKGDGETGDGAAGDGEVEIGQGCEDDLGASLEQAFSCLFHYPRKNRNRNFEDHLTQPVPLGWKNCLPLYTYFKPGILPEYDSLKQRSISSEFEQLLLRLKRLSGLEQSPVFETHLSSVKAFIQGSLAEAPATSASTDPVHQDLYYLLADFYFKNNETSKAMAFYTLDLCIQPRRFDSWAALALAYSKKLEEDLALNEKTPMSLSTSTLRCFRRAMQLNEGNSKLWIEYGSCTYMLQSTASYLHKLHHNFFMPKLELLETTISTTPDTTTTTTTTTAAAATTELLAKLHTTPEELLAFKTEMLQLSRKCFEQAMKHDSDAEEEWLEHYMIGKTTEKQALQPLVFLTHYAQAGDLLHLEKAKYPRKNISFCNPPYLAVESLEMFYRTHASVVKYLLKHEDNLQTIDFDTLETFVSRARQAPLVRGHEHQGKTDSKRSVDLLFEEESFLLMSGNVADHHHHHHHHHHHQHQHQRQLGGQQGVVSMRGSSSSGGGGGGSSSSSGGDQAVDGFEGGVAGGRSQGGVVVGGQEGGGGLEGGPDASCKMEVSIDDVIIIGEESLKEEVVLCDGVKKEGGVVGDVVGAGVGGEVGGEVDGVEKVDVVVGGEKKDVLGGLEGGPVCEGEVDDEFKMLESKLAELEGNGGEMTDAVRGGSGEEVVSGEPAETSGSHSQSSTNCSTNCSTNDETKAPKHQNATSKTSSGADSKQPSDKLGGRFVSLMHSCMRAFSLVLSRYPWHFKSQYRLAHIYFHCRHLKNLSFCRELLIGNSFHLPVNGFRCQSLFQERKVNNFFNGVWRLPSSDLDRFGSFASHLCRSVVLLFHLLRRSVNSSLLFQLHMQLSRCPDNANKKYLRDYDRQILSREAFHLSVQILRQRVTYLTEKEAGSWACEKTRDEMVDVMANVLQMRMQSLKMTTSSLDTILHTLYQHLTRAKQDYKPSLDEIRRFCNQQQTSRLFQRPQAAKTHQSSLTSPPPPSTSFNHPLSKTDASNNLPLHCPSQTTPNLNKSTPAFPSSHHSSNLNLYNSTTSHAFSPSNQSSTNPNYNHSQSVSSHHATSPNVLKVTSPSHHHQQYYEMQQQQHHRQLQQTPGKQPQQPQQHTSHKQLFVSPSQIPKQQLQQQQQQHNTYQQPKIPNAKKQLNVSMPLLGSFQQQQPPQQQKPQQQQQPQQQQPQQPQPQQQNPIQTTQTSALRTPQTQSTNTSNNISNNSNNDGFNNNSTNNNSIINNTNNFSSTPNQTLLDSSSTPLKNQQQQQQQQQSQQQQSQQPLHSTPATLKPPPHFVSPSPRLQSPLIPSAHLPPRQRSSIPIPQKTTPVPPLLLSNQAVLAGAIGKRKHEVEAPSSQSDQHPLKPRHQSPKQQQMHQQQHHQQLQQQKQQQVFKYSQQSAMQHPRQQQQQQVPSASLKPPPQHRQEHSQQIQQATNIQAQQLKPQQPQQQLQKPQQQTQQHTSVFPKKIKHHLPFPSRGLQAPPVTIPSKEATHTTTPKHTSSTNTNPSTYPSTHSSTNPSTLPSTQQSNHPSTHQANHPPSNQLTSKTTSSNININNNISKALAFNIEKNARNEDVIVLSEDSD